MVYADFSSAIKKVARALIKQLPTLHSNQNYEKLAANYTPFKHLIQNHFLTSGKTIDLVFFKLEYKKYKNFKCIFVL